MIWRRHHHRGVFSPGAPMGVGKVLFFHILTMWARETPHRTARYETGINIYVHLYII